MKATLFNIQKFSLHDGPGIRTVLFFKGCPLHCLWCSNPESQSSSVEITINHQKCQHCLSCLKHCPVQAITYVDEHILINQEACLHCFECIHTCPNQAIDKEGEKQSLEVIVEEVLKDIDFYEESGGGVTFSGGEFLGQADTAIALAHQLKQHQIHIACETTGYADEETFKKAIAPIDLLLFDMKHYDPKKHQFYTGVDNQLIMNNMRYAVSINKEIIARIPVIPQVNDQLADAQHFSLLLLDIGIKKVDLLPFHQFGQNKYDLLNQVYQMKDVPALHREDLLAYQKVFIEAGLDCHL